ncbi:DUF3300 domain-containing protein [Shewanella cyperi]|nr:DUF3300 domain-containing protein [Shewanella cyperi]
MKKAITQATKAATLALCAMTLFAAPVTQALAAPQAQEHQAREQEWGNEKFSDAELAQMLAPIALYPDSLLTHILIAASYPLEVVQANRWRKKHDNLSSDRMMSEAGKQDWDPSVVALVAFPNVLEKMSEDLDWTQRLGDAFLDDEARVLDSIQQLRRDADRANSLDDMDKLVVKRVNTQIIIEAPQPEVVYVPYYDPRTVYGYWRWSAYPPVYWTVFPNHRHHHGHFWWHSGIGISFNFYFGSVFWAERYLVVNHHHHYHRPPATRISISNGGSRWHHNPHHRHGVAYRTPEVKHRYFSHAPSQFERHQAREHEVRQLTPGKASWHAVKERREQGFEQKLRGEPKFRNEAKFSNEPRSRDVSKYRDEPKHRNEPKFSNEPSHKAEVRSPQREIHQPKAEHRQAPARVETQKPARVEKFERVERAPKQESKPRQDRGQDMRSHQPARDQGHPRQESRGNNERSRHQER